MTTLNELKRIRDRESEGLEIENAKIEKARKLKEEKQELIQEIKELKEARMENKGERQDKESDGLGKLKKTGKKVGKKIMDYLYALKGE